MLNEIHLKKVRNEYQIQIEELHLKNERELFKIKGDIELNKHKLYNEKERQDKEFAMKMEILTNEQQLKLKEKECEK